MATFPQFIREHTEEILAEWETFARTLPMTKTMDVAALRDHAKDMLGVIARDLETKQTSGEQFEKAQGKSDADDRGPPATAAQEHGAARAVSGFTIADMLSELRALRASVIRLWARQKDHFVVADMTDMTRFNEAIDQAIAESVTQYSENIGQSKERFLAILGHDLRTPLSAIIMSASFMREMNELAEPHRHLVARIESSARRMNDMVSDLLDYTRSSFGNEGIPISRADVDAKRVVEDVAAEVAARYPASTLKVETDGDLRGQWDGSRLAQMLSNLVGNAVQHGMEKTPITVTANGSRDEVVIAVHNEGAPIATADIEQIFKAGGTGSNGYSTPDDNHLGLGLFIVDRIVAAHRGTIDVRSSKTDGTTFTVRLPRAA
jgi:signal transduction histidine kinase